MPGTDKPTLIEPKRLFLRNIVRKVFLEDWLLKLLALAITLGLWLGVTGLATKSTKRLTVQLVTNVANNAKVTNNPDSEIDIVVSGDDRKLKSMSGKDLVASLDISDVQPGDRIILLSPNNVSVTDLPEGIKLEDIPTRRIAVRIETVDEIDLPVVADLEGEPANGFEVYGESVVTPQRIRIRGPVGGLKTLSSLRTDPISLSGRRTDFTERQVRVRLPVDMIVSDTVVDVAVRIGENRIKRTFSVPLAVGAGKKAAVELFGPKSALDRIRPDILKVEMIKTDLGQETPQLTLPPELQNIVDVRKIKVPLQ